MKRIRLIKISNSFKRVIARSFLLSIILATISCGSQNNLLKNNTPKDLTSFEKFIWSRDLDNTIKINKQNLMYITKTTKTSKNNNFNFLHSYSIDLTAVDPDLIELSFLERAYVSAYVVEYLYKCRENLEKDDPYKDSNFVYRLLAPRHANKYNREFKKHDYYGLKLLKKHHLEHFWEYPEQDTIPSIKRIIE